MLVVGREGGPEGRSLVERPVRVLLASPHRLVREGLRAVLAATPDLEVVGDAVDDGSALAAATERSPHVAIVAADLPPAGGPALVRRLHAPPYQVACVVLDREPDDEVVLRAVVAGAVGYVLEDAAPDTLRDAVEVAAAGGSLIDGPTLTELRKRAVGPPVQDALVAGLTEQERRILGMVAEGLTNQEVAERLELAEKTVRNYMSNILAKAGVRNRTELTAYVVRSAAGRH
jgi:two-component system, NarL family, response regulator DevR